MSQASKRWVCLLTDERPQEWEAVNCALIHPHPKGASITTGDYRWLNGKFEPIGNAPRIEPDGYIMTHWLYDPKIWFPDYPDTLEGINQYLIPYIEFHFPHCGICGEYHEITPRECETGDGV